MNSLSVKATNLDSSGSHSIVVSFGGSTLGIDPTCSENSKSITIPTGNTSFTAEAFHYYACAGGVGSITAELSSGTDVVDRVELELEIAATTDAPSISISGLHRSLGTGGTDEFTVRAQGLGSSASYSISIATDAAAIGFENTCSTRDTTVAVPAGSASHQLSRTLHGCTAAASATLIAKLLAGETPVAVATSATSVISGPSTRLYDLPPAIRAGQAASITANAQNLRTDRSYQIRISSADSSLGFDRSCGQSSKQVNVAAGANSNNSPVRLFACEGTGGTITASLIEQQTEVHSEAYSVIVLPPPPSIAISGLGSSLDVGSSDEFTVTAANLDSAVAYSVQVTTDNGNAGFDDTCADREESPTVGQSVTSFTSSALTLRGCSAGSVTVTAKLLSGTSAIANATQDVTVPEPPSIAISGLGSSLDVGSSDEFTVTAANLDSAVAYSVQVTTDNGNAGFDDTCADREESPTVGQSVTSFTSSALTLRGCSAGSVTVTAKLLSGTSAIANATQDVTVPEPPSIKINDLADSVADNSNDSFTVTAANLDSAVAYSVQVTTDNGNAGFDDTCADREESPTVGQSVTSFTSSALTLRGCSAGSVTVTAKLLSGTSVIANATQSVTVVAAPARVTNLDFGLVGAEVWLSWNLVSGDVTGYEVLRRAPAAGEKELSVIATVNEFGNAHVDSNVVSGEVYVYRVRALNGIAKGRASLPIRVTIP